MKKLLAALLFLPALCWATYIPVNGSTITVLPPAGTSLPVSGTGIFSVTSTTTSFNGMQQPINLVSVGSTSVVTGGTNGSIGVGGLAAAGASTSGNPVAQGMIVSSATLPTQQTDAKIQFQASDSYGRTITQAGVATGMLQIATATITTDTVPRVLISSPAAGSYNYVCGCVVTNISATNSYVTLFGQNAGTFSNSIPIGTPANNIPAGIWTGCDRPILRSQVAGNAIQIKGNDSVTSLLVSCQFYVSP